MRTHVMLKERFEPVNPVFDNLVAVRPLHCRTNLYSWNGKST